MSIVGALISVREVDGCTWIDTDVGLYKISNGAVETMNIWNPDNYKGL